MSSILSARPPQEPEVFPLVAWHNHPQYQGFYVFRNGDVWIDVGSQIGHIGQFDIRRFPPDHWIVLQDNQGAALPIAVYIERFGTVYGRWLSPNSGIANSGGTGAATHVSAPTNPAALSQSSGASQGLDIAALFGLASTQTTTVPSEYQSTMEDFIDFVQCVLGIVFSERQLDWLRARTVQALSQQGSPDAQIIESNLTTFQSAKGADAQTRHAWRQENQPRFVKWLGETKSELFQTLRQWHIEAQKVIANGQPPLTREAAESWVELSATAVLLAQGNEPGTAAPENLEAMISQVAHDYPGLPTKQRLWIAFAPIALYELRRSWPTLSAESREALRVQLADQFGIQLSPAGGSSQSPEKADRSVPAPSAPTQDAAAPNWDQFRKADSSVDTLQRQWSEAMEKGDEQKAAELKTEIEKALQRQEAANTMLSNIASMRHSMMMAVANNLR